MQVPVYSDLDGHLRRARRRFGLAMAGVVAVALALAPAVHALPASVLASYPPDLLMFAAVLIWSMFGVAVASAMSHSMPRVAPADDVVRCLGMVKRYPPLLEEFKAAFEAQGQRMLVAQLRHFEEKGRESLLAVKLT